MMATGGVFIKRLGVFLLGLCLLPASLWAAPPWDEPLDLPPFTFDFPQVQQFKLDNGIRVYFLPDKELPLMEMSARLAGGAVQEGPQQTGLHRLMAAALRNGGTASMEPAAFDRALAQRAIDLSVSSSSYSLNFHISSHGEDWHRALELWSSLLRQPGWDRQRLATEKQRLQEQLRRQYDHPRSLAQRLLPQLLYPGHPLGRIPDSEQVQGLSRQQVQAFYQRYAHPRNLWLAVSGDISRSRLEKQLNASLGQWQPRQEYQQPQTPQLPQPADVGLWLVHKDVPQTTLLLAQRGITKDNPDLYALKVMNHILGGGGFTSRLMQQVRSNRGLAYSVYSHLAVGRRLPGQFMAGAESRQQTAYQALQIIRRQQQQLQEQLVTAEELATAKDNIIHSFVFAFENPHQVAARQMRLDFFGYPEDYMAKYQQRIQAVTRQDVKRVARHYLKPQQQSVVVVGGHKQPPQDWPSENMPITRIKAHEIP